MDLSLKRTHIRAAGLAISLTVSAIVIFQASELWLADHRINSQSYELMERGAAMMPGNGEAWDRLGRYRQYDLAGPDPSAAILDYQKALQDDPRSAVYWMDLGSAYEDTGEFGKARNAYEQAVYVYPTSADVAFNYGNFLLRRDDYARAYAQIQRATRTDPSLLPLAISRAWLATGSINQLLDEALPANAQAYWQALDFFVSDHRMDLSLVVWRHLTALHVPLPLSRSFAFFDGLIADNRAENALRTWHEALSAAGAAPSETANLSMISDGGFREDFFEGGLGWRWNPTPTVSIDFDAGPEGRSVRLDFEGGANVDLDSPAQYVPVQPGHAYHFQGYLRTEGITTESGVRFSIVDPNHFNEVNVTTDNFIGSHAWTKVDADIVTAPDTHFLLIRLQRTPSQMFDNKLSGTAWIADISLVDTSAPGAQKP